MADVFEITGRENKIVRVDGKEYILAFTFAATAELEEKLGRSMKHASDWFKLQTKEVQAALEAGFRHHQPEDAARVAAEISTLDPEQLDGVIDMLCAAAFPKAVERLAVELEKMRKRIKEGLPALPNASGADAS